MSAAPSGSSFYSQQGRRIVSATGLTGTTTITGNGVKFFESTNSDVNASGFGGKITSLAATTSTSGIASYLPLLLIAGLIGGVIWFIRR